MLPVRLRPHPDDETNGWPRSCTHTLRTIYAPPPAPRSGLRAVFEPLAPPGRVTMVRVMGSQCYGFVTFDAPQHAQRVLELARGPEGVHAADGTRLRVAQAQGTMPSWKVGRGMWAKGSEGPGLWFSGDSSRSVCTVYRRVFLVTVLVKEGPAQPETGVVSCRAKCTVVVV